MNRSLHSAAFCAGLAALCWVGAGYVPAHPLALAMTVLIGVFFLMGALELQRFRGATISLSAALTQLREPPASLEAWLSPIDPGLQGAVRLRIEGARVALPGPYLTPYLAGLLVLLGMLGTFLGMVVTLKGTALALDGAADLLAVRSVLSAPVKGLGLAFGTSVAGVAASAALGLMSAMCRRERLQVSQRLDAAVAGALRAYSHEHRRDESFRLLQRQAESMPALVDAMQAVMATLERQAQALNERLVSGQESFHDQAAAAYEGLAASVDRTLRQSLTDSARTAAAAIPPVVEAAMAEITARTHTLHDGVSQAVQHHLDGLSGRFETGTRALVESMAAANAAARDDVAAREQQRLAQWTGTLQAMAASLTDEWQQAGARTLDQQQQICRMLEHTARDIGAQAQAHARDTIAEIARLVEAASQAPRAAAEVVAELREQLSAGLARDNVVLEERSRIMQTLATLLDTLNHASTEQRAAIDALVVSSADLLGSAGARFTEQVDAETEKMISAAAQVTAGAVEVSSLGEAFGFAVQLFSASSDKLLAQLKSIEGALGQSLARSDDQLAYYVAQAREIVDLSVMSQKQVIEDLQQIATQRAVATAEA